VSSARGRGEVGDHEEVLNGGDSKGATGYPPVAEARAAGSGLQRVVALCDPPVMRRGGGDVSWQGGAPGYGGFLRRTMQTVNQQ
jgi:hypothetical protein